MEQLSETERGWTVMDEFLIVPPQQYSSCKERDCENMVLRDFSKAKNKLICVTKEMVEKEENEV